MYVVLSRSNTSLCSAPLAPCWMLSEIGRLTWCLNPHPHPILRILRHLFSWAWKRVSEQEFDLFYAGVAELMWRFVFTRPTEASNFPLDSGRQDSCRLGISEQEVLHRSKKPLWRYTWILTLTQASGVTDISMKSESALTQRFKGEKSCPIRHQSIMEIFFFLSSDSADNGISR